MIWIAGAIGGHFGLCRSRRFGLRAETCRRVRSFVLMAAGVFVASLLFRAGSRRGCSVHPGNRRFKARVHHRQGLLAIARQEPIRETFTLRLLQSRET